ncbi:putative OTU-like cysteine protease [Trichophaea hybrida]|nr:putative OTU-like cysteine protease [Trichophaea hybrida]
MDELLARHRKELRDLQSRITQQKKQATKKTRKAVNSQCDNLEAQAKSRHAREIQELQNPSDNPISSTEANDSVNDNIYIPPPSDSEPETEPEAPTKPPPIAKLSLSDTPASHEGKKPNRQKARLARRAAEAAAASEAAALEASSLPNLREHELAAMATLLKTHNLTEYQIAPDGHCLYSAFSHSLRTVGLELEMLPRDYKEARAKCAEFMKANREDFEAFLEEDFDEHVRKVENTAEWGGQTEVLALGRAFGVKVNVLQTEGRGLESMNDKAEKGEVWLGYYRHAFGLGEHYNSLVRKE